MKFPRSRQQAPSAGLARWMVVAGLLMALSATAFAADQPFNKNKPFAEHFLVLQASDADPARQAMVLSVASNLMEYYGPDLIDIEIVAFGPGIKLVFANNEHIELINSLVAQGVRLIGCMNTIETIIRRTGKKPELNPNMIPVQAGVARILKRTEMGYTLVRP